MCCGKSLFVFEFAHVHVTLATDERSRGRSEVVNPARRITQAPKFNGI